MLKGLREGGEGKKQKASSGGGAKQRKHLITQVKTHLLKEVAANTHQIRGKIAPSKSKSPRDPREGDNCLD